MSNTSKLKKLKIFGCPECRKRFHTIKGLNEHLSKSHDAKYKIHVNCQHRAYTVVKKTVIIA